ncbi:MAG TPA: phosphate acyltransferase PlsX [Candidatus Binatia bacterium]|nr:phosphate acyltransferase PlsX [Candidatus Binatia bacterium]
MPIIAVDAMGGDHAPDEVVKGVAQVSLSTDIECLVVGDESRIQHVLEAVPYNPEHISILHARDAIGMAEEPREAVRTRKDASLVVAVRAVAEGRADAAISAGNTGACVLACAKHFRLIRGIRRAALASVYPRHTEYLGQDRLALLLDVGATVHCEAEELVQFALMGNAYARRISKVASPRIGLLNMGSEETKGGEALVETHRRLRELPGVDFVGNVEGNDLPRGRADVIVCEGLVGNVVLKLIEGMAELFGDLAGVAAERRIAWRVGLYLLSRGIERLRALTDYTQYGGSPILGFERLFLKCHGRSNAHAIANAVKVAAKAVRDRVPEEIGAAIAALR